MHFLKNPFRSMQHLVSERTVLVAVALYFSLLVLISFLTGRNRSDSQFFLGSRRSRWYVVAIGMIGSSVSGISLVSVPGMVLGSGFTYLQTAFGFVAGYAVVALVLLPLYFKMNLTSIYGYLQHRFGQWTHRTGAWFFIVSKTVTSAVKLYVAVLVLQHFVFSAWDVPLWVTVTVCVLMIWLYTFRSGIGTIVWTDALQTIVLFAVIILMLFQVVDAMNLSFMETIHTVKDSPLSRIFVFDWMSDRTFFKQFFSGVFIVVVMTGLSQDMVQSTLSCRNIREAQKNMLWYGTAFVPFNLLLLSLGVLLVVYAGQTGVALPDKTDEIVPLFASELLGKTVYICFIFGIIASTFNSADSALTAIVTSVYIDIMKRDRAARPSPLLRNLIYLTVCFVLVLIVLAFANMGNRTMIDTLYMFVGYAYGPLLGLFAFGLLTRRQTNDRVVPCICVTSPILTYLTQMICLQFFQYQFGYELLIMNGMITFAGLWSTKNTKKSQRSQR